MTSHYNYKDIYDLLDKLCKNLSGTTSTKHKELLRHVTHYISNSPNALATTLPYDESSLVSKITNHLSNNTSSNDVVLFNNLHEQLKACQTEQRQRSALLTFLFYMADAKNNLPNNGLDDGSKYSLRTDLLKKNYATTPSITATESSSKESMASSSTLTNGDKMQLYIRNKSSSMLYKTSSSENNLKLAHIKNIKTKFQSDSSDSCSPRDSRLFKNNSNSNGPGCNSGGNIGIPKINEQNVNLNDDIVQNVIYSFTGIQGKYLKKDIISGGFKLDPRARNLNIVQAGMLLRLSELGYYHDQVQSYADAKSGKCALGLMGQGFISALKNELTKYYGMVAMLQEQLNKQRQTENNDWHNHLAISPVGDKVTLMKIMVWAVDPLQRLQWLSQIAEACQEKKGGALASTVYEFLSNGDPMVKSLVRELLLAICGPLHHQLSRWLLEGEIIDPHCEFFIECLSEVGPDRLWHEKYRVRTSMLPKFITTDMANKILVTGKSINFLREICEDKTPIKGREELKQCFELNADNIFSNVADTKLHTIIDSVYLNTSKKVLDIVVGPHKLLDHLQAMRRYLLLGQGDFIGILMENLKSELDKPGKDLYCYELSSIMDAAIRSTNAQYDDPDILNHLDVRLINAYDGDTGWDILSLNYTVRGPLATMLEASMHNYQILFKPLWRMKHIEFLLTSKIWKEQMCNAKPLRPLSLLLNPIMYRLNLYTSEMIHFIHQMEYYILFEVIECAWATFQEKVHLAKAIDDILYAHDEFLENIKAGAFLDEKSEMLSLHMSEVYVGITRLEIWQDKFFETCFKELNAQKKFADNIKQSAGKGEYGVTAEKRLERDNDHKIFEQYIFSCQKSLEKIGNDYEQAVRQFLLTLNSNNDHNLQLFGMRLDFNEYYKKRDQRLDVPLTFEHMRMKIDNTNVTNLLVNYGDDKQLLLDSNETNHKFFSDCHNNEIVKRPLTMRDSKVVYMACCQII